MTEAEMSNQEPCPYCGAPEGCDQLCIEDTESWEPIADD